MHVSVKLVTREFSHETGYNLLVLLVPSNDSSCCSARMLLCHVIPSLAQRRSAAAGLVAKRHVQLIGSQGIAFWFVNASGTCMPFVALLLNSCASPFPPRQTPQSVSSALLRPPPVPRPHDSAAPWHDTAGLQPLTQSFPGPLPSRSSRTALPLPPESSCRVAPHPSAAEQSSSAWNLHASVSA
jgi:hypothetical protein